LKGRRGNLWSFGQWSGAKALILCGGRQKDCASPEVRGVRVFACRWFALRS